MDIKIKEVAKKFNNKVVWITGASSGIGEALAYAFSAEGARLILSSRRRDQLERVRKACSHADEVKILPLDLLEVSSLDQKTAEAIACFGHIDIMVHNGGISQRSLVRETDLAVHRKVMELDYFSYIAITKALLPHFEQRKDGHFVVISSVMGKIGTPMRSAYAAAKHALHGYFDCLRAEVSPMNIKVTLLTPGYIQTNVSKNALTKEGKPLGTLSQNIASGLPADLAAKQILKAVANSSFESYIGKFGGEKIALWLNRFLPSVIIKKAPGLSPK